MTPAAPTPTAIITRDLRFVAEGGGTGKYNICPEGTVVELVTIEEAKQSELRDDRQFAYHAEKRAKQAEERGEPKRVLFRWNGKLRMGQLGDELKADTASTGLPPNRHDHGVAVNDGFPSWAKRKV